jgi:hypothetical protein
MTINTRSTARMPAAQFVSVLVSLCALVFLPISPFASMVSAESAEGECPCEEEGENLGESGLVFSAAHTGPSCRGGRHVRRSREATKQLYRIVATRGRLPVIVGHQLAGDVDAPFLI